MPTPEAILGGLAAVADRAFPLAVAWHVAVAAALVALLAGWRPSRRLAGTLLAIPALSASAVAFAFGNPFNGAVLGAASLALAITASRLDPRPARPAPTWALAAGAAMVAFAWIYPHFLAGRSALAYLYGAPTGLVPCPTLSLMIGFALIAGGLGSRTWALILAAVGLFYGAFGALRLGVAIDVALIAGALCLALLATLTERTYSKPRFPRAPPRRRRGSPMSSSR